jgi:hypothetical protein
MAFQGDGLRFFLACPFFLFIITEEEFKGLLKEFGVE